jgi:hypothetical protein
VTRWTDADLRALQARNCGMTAGQVKQAHKYHATPNYVDGLRFDSKLEAELYKALKLRQQARQLRYFLRQVPFELEGGVKYRADFVAFPYEGIEEVWDAKGVDTPLSSTKRRQVEARYNIRILLWTRTER